MSSLLRNLQRSLFFFFNDTATTEIYTLSLHDALPISMGVWIALKECPLNSTPPLARWLPEATNQLHPRYCAHRSEEHTSELQSRLHLVCRLLLEKKKKKNRKFRI